MADESSNQAHAPNNMPRLGDTWRDRGAGLVKGAVGLIPVAGPVLAEVIGEIIPVQRIERLEDYCRRLNERLGGVEENDLREKLSDAEKVDLFEDGAYQAARALTDKRREYIANVVAKGLAGGEKEKLEAKRLLKVLGEIGDDQIIILTSYLHRHNRDDEFHRIHADVLEPVLAHMQSTQAEHDSALMSQLARSELIRLGLLKVDYPNVKKGEVPEFDRATGMVKGGSRGLTSLARMLLAYVGVAAPGEF